MSFTSKTISNHTFRDFLTSQMTSTGCMILGVSRQLKRLDLNTYHLDADRAVLESQNSV